MNKWIIAGVITLAAVGLSAQAKGDKTDTKMEKHPPCSFADVVAKYDTNKDGKLDDTEKATMTAKEKKRFEKTMEKYDTNKDGILDEAETTAMKAAIKAQFTKKDKKAPVDPTAPVAPATPVAPAQ